MMLGSKGILTLVSNIEEKRQKMEAYEIFASVYEELMDNVPYEAWAEKIGSILKKYGICDGLVLDLACGTGTLTRLLSGMGYDMIGVDASEEMLLRAGQAENPGEKEILYLHQDMRDFELYGTVEAVICACDSLNYILEEEELLKVFSLVNNYLEKDGLFIFDMNTEYKFAEVLGDSTIAENREDLSFIWENTYDAEEKINEYALTMYLEEENGLYRRYEEFHYEKAYTLEEIRKLLSKAGMQFVGAFDGYEMKEVSDTTERFLIIAREGHQENKYYGKGSEEKK